VLDTLAQEEIDIFDNAAGTDPAALFAAAYRTFAGPVQGYLKARGLDDPEAVTQDVFMAFYPRIGNLTGGLQGAKSLIFSIAHARMVDHYRRLERRPQLTPYDPQQDGRTTPSAEHQEVLALRVVADLSIEQVAAIMGKSTGAIKQLQRRALQNLKAQTLKRNQANHE